SGEVEGLLHRERRLLRGPRLAGWRLEDREDRQGPSAGGRAAPAGNRALSRQPAFWAGRLRDFPWDVLGPYADRARQHPDGIVDLSVGTPVDPVPDVVQAALAAAADSPGYPATAGPPDLQAAIAGYLSARCAAPAGIAVLPTIGSKELVAWLPLLLGVRPGGTVAIPALAYPTYAVGVELAGA